MMKNKNDPVKSSTRTARILIENDISKGTSAEVRNSENCCPFDVIMLNKTVSNLSGNIETNKICLGQITSRTEGKMSLSSIESLLVKVNKQDIVLCR